MKPLTAAKDAFNAFVGIVSMAPILFLAGIALSFLLHMAIPLPILTGTRDGMAIAGGILVLIGTVLVLWANKISRNLFSPKYDYACFDFSQGPYKYSRHPGTLGFMLMFVGFSLAVNSAVMVIIAIAIFALMSFVFIPIEEAFIRDKCRAEYEAYEKRVRMWL